MKTFHLAAAAGLAMVSCAGSESSTEQPVTVSDITDPISTTDAPSVDDDATSTSSSSPAHSSTSSSSPAAEDPTTTETGATPDLDEPTDPLTRLLLDVGASIDTAPVAAQALDGAELCNSSNDLGSLVDTSADEEECFRDAIESSQPAVLVAAFYTDEGDPIVRVQRELPASGTIQVFEDSSQDTFAGVGAPSWRSYECSTDQISRQESDGGASILTC